MRQTKTKNQFRVDCTAEVYFKSKIKLIDI